MESYARTFARHALGRTITRVRVLDQRILAVRKSTLMRALVGRQFTSVHRHGKHLFARAGDVWLRLHFGMSGDLSYVGPASDGPIGVKPDPHPGRFARVVFEFDDGGHLAFQDLRLFGVVDLVDDPDVFIRERGLGPDPLMLGLRGFRARVARRRGAIKALLLSQNVIAGVGNLYADETLFRAGIHPRRGADQLSAEEVKAIFNSMRRVLREAISEREIFLVNHRQDGERCPRCGGTMQRTVVGGRTTYFCARHQR